MLTVILRVLPSSLGLEDTDLEMVIVEASQYPGQAPNDVTV
jgi:hypothetical protein